MYLDIRVSKHKVGRLAVRNGDDTKVLVDNFARSILVTEYGSIRIIQ